jgi:hypothetical protein
MTNGQNYTYSLAIPSVSNQIMDIKSSILSFDVYISPTVTFNLWVNNQPCNNPTYTISTTYASAGQSRITFDCSNVIKKAGTYSVTIKPTQQNTGAITGWIDVSYSLTPSGEMTVHGTEYAYPRDLTAKVWLQLIDSNGSTVNDAICYADIYTPSGEEYLESATLTNMEHDGIYYLNLPVPSSNFGVYPAIAKCYYIASQFPYYVDSYNLINGTYSTGTISSLQIDDGSFIRFVEAISGGIRRVNVEFNLSNGTQCLNTSELFLTGITLSVNALFNSAVNDDISISIFNYSSSSWILLPNVILEGATENTASNSLFFNNITKALGINSANPTKIRLMDTVLADGTNNNLDIDQAIVSCDQLASPEWQSVMGSSELHVTSLSTEPFYAETLCGSNEVGDDTSDCSQFFYNISFYDTIWGYTYENISFINSQQTDIDSVYFYETPLGQDCTGLFEVIRSDNVSSYSILENVSLSSGTKDNCIIGIPVQFSVSQRYFNVELYMENYMVWEAQRDRDFVNYFRDLIVPFCDSIELANNNPFYVPINGTNDVSTLYSNNPIYLGCYRAIDDLYWFDKFYTDSLLIGKSGEYESYLYNFRLYYPELRSYAGVVQSIIGLDTLNNVNSLCGEDNILHYGCAELKSPDAFFSSQEGYVLENLTVSNVFNSTVNSHIHYETARGMDCSSVMQVIKENGTLTDLTDDVEYSSGSKDNCIMNIPSDTIIGESSYNIEIYMENYISWDILWARDRVAEWNETISPFCYDLANNLSLSYYIPINSSISYYLNQSEFYSCYRALDDVYWWYFFFDLYQNSNYTTIGEIESIHYESEFFWTKILEDYNFIQTYKRNNNQIQILEFLQEAKDNAHLRVWNYTNRSLSEPFSINETSLISSIASAIWGWTGSVSSTITNTFSSVFWSNANYSEVARYVWEYNNRSLTFYQVNNISAGEIFNYLNGSLTIADTYNYSKSAETNWNYLDRNLTVYPIGNNITIADIWSYYNRSLSDNGVLQIWGMNNISADVWSYQNRTLTYYTINFTDLIGMISNYTYSDIGFTLLPSQESYQLTGNLNVILVSPQYAGK